MLVAIMGVVSLLGASIGVRSRERMPLRPLKSVVCAYLLVVGVWMIYPNQSSVESMSYSN